MGKSEIERDVDDPFIRTRFRKPYVELLQANVLKNAGNGNAKMTLEAQLQRSDADAGLSRQFFQIERIGRMRLQTFPRPLKDGGQRVALRRRPMDGIAEIMTLTGEQEKPDNRFAQRGRLHGRQIRSWPAVLSEIDQIFNLKLKGTAERRAEVDMGFELHRTGRPFRKRGSAAFHPVPIHQQNELRAIVLPDHPGRQRGRQQRRHGARLQFDFEASGLDMRPAADRYLQQKEAVEAARIDRY